MRVIDCPVCMNKGFILHRRDGYEYKHKCSCRRGVWHSYDGAECGKEKSDYYCAELPDGAEKAIAQDNIKRYGLRKSADRYLMDEGPKLTDEELKECRKLAWQMMGVKV